MAIRLLLLSIAKGTYNYDALKETSLVHTREVNWSPLGGWNVLSCPQWSALNQEEVYALMDCL